MHSFNLKINWITSFTISNADFVKKICLRFPVIRNKIIWSMTNIPSPIIFIEFPFNKNSISDSRCWTLWTHASPWRLHTFLLLLSMVPIRLQKRSELIFMLCSSINPTLCFVHCLAVQFQRGCSIFFTKLQNQDNSREEQYICVIIVCLWPCLLTGRSNLGVFLHVNIILMV